MSNLTYTQRLAIGRLEEIESYNGGLINGNFSFVAKQHKLKVKDLRQLWAEHKAARNG